MPGLRVVIAGDAYGKSHAKAIEADLSGKHDVTFVGCDGDERYAALAARVAQDVMDGTYDRGILVCGTGMGVCAAAGKVTGVIAVGPICNDYAAERAALSNNAHIITFGAKVSDTEEQNKDDVVRRALLFLHNAPNFDPSSNSAMNVKAIMDVDEMYRK